MESRSPTMNRDNFYDLIYETKRNARARMLDRADTNCTKAIEILKTLKDANPSDYRKASETCHELANKHFNNQNYKSAVEYYNHGIQSLISIEKLNIELTDHDYRSLAECFIDLSDAYMHQYNQEAATNAFLNATKAFNLIKSKTFDEQKAAATNDDYASFRQLYETKLSSQSYVKSREFNNHGIILHQHQEEKKVEEMLSDMFLSPEAKAESNLDEMMEGLTFTPQPLFPDAGIQKEPNDDEYRGIGNQFISLAKNQYAKQLTNDAIETLKQARSAFQRVHYQSETDTNTLKYIDESILQLKNQRTTQQQQPSSSASGLGLFAGHVPVSSAPNTQTWESNNQAPNFNGFSFYQ